MSVRDAITFKQSDSHDFQFAYGLGTARYKAEPTAEPDPEIVKLTVMAINNGYYHLDGAEGKHSPSWILIYISPTSFQSTAMRRNSA